MTTAGSFTLSVSDPPSNAVVLIVAWRDTMQTLTGAPEGEQEPPLSENEPMYIVVGARDYWSARFQLSFKYRLFDYDTGFGLVDAFAAVSAPLPADDAYTRKPDRTIKIPISQLLGNDFDANGDVTGPALVWKIEDGEIKTDRVISIDDMQALFKKVE